MGFKIEHSQCFQHCCYVVSTAYLAVRIRLKEEAAAKAAIINGRAFGTARMLFSNEKKKPKKKNATAQLATKDTAKNDDGSSSRKAAESSRSR